MYDCDAFRHQTSVAGGGGSWVSRQLPVVSRFLDVDGLNKTEDMVADHVHRLHAGYHARLARQRRLIRALLGYMNSATACGAGYGGVAMHGHDYVRALSNS